MGLAARMGQYGEITFWILAYCTASTSMNILNKKAISAMPFPYFLSALQNLATLIMALIVAYLIAPHTGPPFDKTFGLKKKLDLDTLVKWTPAVLLFCLMLVSSLSAMHRVSVPTVLVCRSLTPMVTAALEIQFLGMRVGVRLWGAMGVILIGAICYCIQDFNPSFEGYVWLGINLVAAAGYHVYVKWAIGAVGLSTMDMVIYNNMLSLPLLLLSGLIFDNAGEMPATVGAMRFGDWVMVALSAIVAACISYTGFGLQAAVSATSATVVNHINKVRGANE